MINSGCTNATICVQTSYLSTHAIHLLVDYKIITKHAYNYKTFYITYIFYFLDTLLCSVLDTSFINNIVRVLVFIFLNYNVES